MWMPQIVGIYADFTDQICWVTGIKRGAEPPGPWMLLEMQMIFGGGFTGPENEQNTFGVRHRGSIMQME